jgi:hypothetical protein
VNEYTYAEMRQRIADFAAAARYSAMIEIKYPNYPLAVNVESGMVNVWLLGADLHGYRLKQEGLDEAELLRAAGEILERYNLSRSGFDEAAYLNAPRDVAGRLVGDLA